MNLIVDIGNTMVKAFVTKDGEEVLTTSSKELTIEQLDDIFRHFPNIKRAIVSSVRKADDKIISYLNRRVPTLLLDQHADIPINVQYKTPNTIGPDRLATAVGANALFPDKELLIVDMGTAITVDYVTPQKEFLGGNISPGLNLRFRALHELTHKLPLEQPQENAPFMGRSTSEAIQAGVQNGIRYEISGYISDFLSRNAEGTVIFTGGDAKFFARTIKYPIFVIRNLAMTGLHTILEYNATKV